MGIRAAFGGERAAAEAVRALAALAEPAARGKRVLVCGDATTGLAEALCERGARFVQVVDRDGARLARAVGSHTPHARVAYGADLPPGTFDLLVTTELGSAREPRSEVARLRRSVGATGALLAVVPASSAHAEPPVEPRAASGSGAGLGYYELYDSLTPHFRQVRMFGQAPFVGFTLADFGAGGEPQVNVDTLLLEEPPEPLWFIAVASEGRGAWPSYSVVAVSAESAPEGSTTEPAPPPESGSADEGPARDARALSDEQFELAELRARLTLMAAELDQSHDRERALRGELAAANERLAASAVAAGETRAADARHVAELRNARAASEGALASFEAAKASLAEAREQAARTTHQLAQAQATLTRLEGELAQARSELAQARSERTKLESELAQARERTADAERRASESAAAAADQGARLASQAEAAKADRAKRDAEAKRTQQEAERALAAAETRHASRRAELAAELEARFAAQLEAQRESGLAAERARADERVELHARELAQLEEALRERGRTVAQLRADLRETERLAKELVEDLESARATTATAAVSPAQATEPTAAELAARLDVLAARAAEREADYHAATWRVRTLERELEALKHAQGSPSLGA
jgi:chromosome segregation ATPase